MANIKLTIGYEGTHYRGWQKTGKGKSIESELEKALATTLRQKVPLQAASRTDAGVHARAQVVNFFAEEPLIELWKLKNSLNGLLPKDIVIREIERVGDDFHPTIHTHAKCYHYHVCYGAVQLPHHRFFSWHFPKKLDIAAMRRAATLISGKKSFEAFTNRDGDRTYNHYERQLFGINIIELPGERLLFEVTGDHFLYKMVRNIVGTLCFVGCGKLNGEKLDVLINQKDRRLMGVTAPAHGLTLERICYEDFQFSG